MSLQKDLEKVKLEIKMTVDSFVKEHYKPEATKENLAKLNNKIHEKLQDLKARGYLSPIDFSNMHELSIADLDLLYQIQKDYDVFEEFIGVE